MIYCDLLLRYPDQADLLQLLGVLRFEQGKTAEAISLVRSAIEQNPQSLPYRLQLAHLLERMGQQHQAVESYMECVALAPENARIRAELAAALQRCGHLEQAIGHFRAAAQAAPEETEVLASLATALIEIGERDEPEDLLMRVLNLDPKHHEARSRLAGLYLARGEPHNAAEECRRALTFRPDCRHTRWRYVQALLRQGRWREASVELERHLAGGPDSADARHRLGLSYLACGEFARGWEEFEARLTRTAVPAHHWRAPRWDGEELDGKTILIWAENCINDAIQFSRYIPLVAARGGRAVVECRPELHPLFHRMAAVSAVACPGQQPDIDCEIPLLSLPRVFHTELNSIPPPCALDIPEDLRLEWRERLGSFPGLRVGICGAGDFSEFTGPVTSIPFPFLAGLAAIDGLYIFSLEPGGAAAELSALPANLRVYPLAGDDSSVLDMAAAILGLDLVVTADNALAHLAGTLGAPVWTLLPRAADWRWMDDRTDSPWYPTMRLVRQNTPGDWQSVLDWIARALHWPDAPIL